MGSRDIWKVGPLAFLSPHAFQAVAREFCKVVNSIVFVFCEQNCGKLSFMPHKLSAGITFFECASSYAALAEHGLIGSL